MHKNQTVVASVNHMDRHAHGLLAKGSFQKPTVVASTDFSAEGLPVGDDLVTARATYANRYFTNPDAIAKANGKLLTDILSTIEDQDTCEELRDESHNNGSQLLLDFEADLLNRVTGPTDSGVSSFELLENLKPKVLPIQPFGCRTVVVRPRHTYSKRTIDPHGEKDINLGRSPTIVNAFRVWIPSRGTVVTTSEVYFDATQMPWRAAGDQQPRRAVVDALVQPLARSPARSPPAA